jgi:hypothetical protein
VGSNPVGGIDFLLVSVECCLVEESASDRSLVKRSHSECGVSECDHKSLIMRRPWPTRNAASWYNKIELLYLVHTFSVPTTK